MFQSTLQISHPVPLLCGGQRDLSASCHLEQDSLLHPLSLLPHEQDQHLLSVGPQARPWPQAVVWPSWDGPEGGTAQRPLSIEAEARLHRQCAGTVVCGLCSHHFCPFQIVLCQVHQCIVQYCVTETQDSRSDFSCLCSVGCFTLL